MVCKTERRCICFNKKNGRRCGNCAMKNSDRCGSHQEECPEKGEKTAEKREYEDVEKYIEHVGREGHVVEHLKVKQMESLKKEEVKVKKEERDEDLLRHPMFPIAQFVPPFTEREENYNDAKAKGPEAARLLCCNALAKLSRTNNCDIWVGMVKETIKYGNTSVSMGVSYAQYLDWKWNMDHGMDEPKDNRLFCVNYGGGGPNVQEYHIDMKTGNIYLHREESAKGKDNKLNFHEIKLDEDSKEVSRKITILREVIFNAFKLLGVDDPSTVNTRAFITGDPKIRQNYFRGGQDADIWRKRTEELMSGLTPWGKNILDKYPSSYFIPQEMEGKFELLGIQKMWQTLKKHVSSKFTIPIASIGIGTSTIQVAIAGEIPFDKITIANWDRVGEVITIDGGMNNKTAHELKALDVKILSAFRSSDFSTNATRLLDMNERPMIALKSGCLFQKDVMVKDLSVP
jgi:hypothetical protein